MTPSLLTLQEEYWEDFELEEKDLAFLYEYLLEKETPLTSAEILPILLEKRIAREIVRLESQRLDGNEIYYPREEYDVGTGLVFPALSWKKGEVTGIRGGENPEYGEFKVIQVEFEDGLQKEFASKIENHILNDSEDDEEDNQLTPESVVSEHGEILESRIEEGLALNDDFVQIAGRWFLRALLVDVNVGHLNLAEAVLDMHEGGPLSTRELIDQVELKSDVNPNLIEFSMDYALLEDPRFDEVGPAGIVSWFLKDLEPEGVQKTPLPLQYIPVDYDPASLTDDMQELEQSLDDELTPWERQSTGKGKEVEVRLIFPHWRAGSLPLSRKVKPLFPTAYEAPRIRVTLVDGKNGDRFPGWVVRNERYVYGLRDWYESKGLIPGAIVRIKPGKETGEVIVNTESSRSSKNWMRTLLVGSDGELVFATLKQIVSSEYNERMAVVIPDLDPIDQVWETNQANPPPFEQIVVDIVRELTKLNTQGHVHITEMYAAVNTVRRCPPGPLMSLLEDRPWFVHVGDLHFRFDDSETK